MSTNQNATLLAEVKQLDLLFNQLNSVLLKEKNDIMKKNLLEMEANNKQKSSLISEISNLVIQMTDGQDNQSLLATIESVSNRLEPKAKSELLANMEKMKTSMTECNKSLLVNSNIIYTNLNQIKSFWDKVMACNVEMNCTYDNTGNKVK